MNVLLLLVPVSLSLGLLGLGLFFWSVRSNQYEDPEGQSNRILDPRFDQSPSDKAGEQSGKDQ